MPTENRVRTYTVAELERLATDYLAQHFGPDVLSSSPLTLTCLFRKG